MTNVAHRSVIVLHGRVQGEFVLVVEVGGGWGCWGDAASCIMSTSTRSPNSLMGFDMICFPSCLPSALNFLSTPCHSVRIGLSFHPPHHNCNRLNVPLALETVAELRFVPTQRKHVGGFLPKSKMKANRIELTFKEWDANNLFFATMRNAATTHGDYHIPQITSLTTLDSIFHQSMLPSSGLVNLIGWCDWWRNILNSWMYMNDMSMSLKHNKIKIKLNKGELFTASTLYKITKYRARESFTKIIGQLVFTLVGLQ